MTDNQKNAERLAENLVREAAVSYQVTRKDNATGPVVKIAGSGYDTNWEVYLRLTPIIEAIIGRDDTIACLTEERDEALRRARELQDIADLYEQFMRIMRAEGKLPPSNTQALGSSNSSESTSR